MVVDDPLGPSILVVPRDADATRSLVVVSHCLGRTPFDQIEWMVFERLLQPLAEAGHALLLSYDGGKETYGNDLALDYNRRVVDRVAAQRPLGLTLLTLGISMGGLPALLAAFRGTLQRPIAATAIVSAVTNLGKIHEAPPERRARVNAAYDSKTPEEFRRASRGHDPVGDFAHIGTTTPIIAIASRRDEVVPLEIHSEPLIDLSRAIGSPSRLIKVDAPHIGEDYFTPRVAESVVSFFLNYGPG